MKQLKKKDWGKKPGSQYSEIPIQVGAGFFIILLTPHHLFVLFICDGLFF